MAARFVVHPFETAYRRQMLFAVELLDPVSFAPVSNISVTATGLSGKPIVNPSGQFVWLTEGDAAAQRVLIEPLGLPYESENLPAPAPPARLMRVILRPKRGYAFAGAVSAIRSGLYETIADPLVPVRNADVWLRWIDDNTGATLDAPTRGSTGTTGDFVAFVRFTPADTPRLDAGGRLRVRLRVDRAGTVRTSSELALEQGRTADLPPFAWDAL